jgi:hypothetical protein
MHGSPPSCDACAGGTDLCRHEPEPHAPDCELTTVLRAAGVLP